MQALVDHQKARTSSSRRGTGSTTPSRSERRTTRSTTRRSSRTSSSIACCRDGVFFAANKLYGLTFKERHDIPVYQPDVRVFEVFDEDGKSFALFYADYFKRDNKSGGAWMDSFVDQSGLLGTHPVVFNVCNFTKPAPGQPALLTLRRRDDDVPRVRARAPRPVLEREVPARSRAPTSRATSSSSRRSSTSTGRASRRCSRTTPSTTRPARPCRRSSSKKVQKASKHNQGFATTEYLAAALLDMAWHTLPGRHGRRRTSTSSRPRRCTGSASTSRSCRRATARPTSRTSGRAATRPATTRTCGARCSTTTRSSGSWRTAG